MEYNGQSVALQHQILKEKWLKISPTTLGHSRKRVEAPFAIKKKSWEKITNKAKDIKMELQEHPILLDKTRTRILEPPFLTISNSLDCFA